MSGMISPFQMNYNKVVSFSINQYDSVQEPESINISLGVDFEISDVIKIKNKWNARLDLFVKLTGTTQTEDKEKVFEIALKMMGNFEADIMQIEEQKFMEMLKINGVSTLMQLSRAYITSVSAQSGFEQPINFPMVNVFELNKMRERAKPNNN